MIFQPVDWSNFHKELPVTFGLTVLMSGLFVLYFFGVIDPFFALEGIIHPYVWAAHFFHATPLHLLSNLLILILTGMIIERDLGHFKYFLLVLLILNLTVLFLYYSNPNLVFGFSGVGMGLMVFAACYGWNNQQNREMLFILVGINLVFGLMPGVSWHGHLFGALAGIVSFGIFRILNPTKY